MMTHVNFLDPVVLTSENLPLDSLLHNSVYYPGYGQVVVYERKDEFTNNIEGVSVTPDTTGSTIR